MPAATITIETSMSTDIFTIISCNPIVSNGTGFHWYLYHLHCSKKKKKQAGFLFLTTKCETGILCLTF